MTTKAETAPKAFQEPDNRYDDDNHDSYSSKWFWNWQHLDKPDKESDHQNSHK